MDSRKKENRKPFYVIIRQFNIYCNNKDLILVVAYYRTFNKNALCIFILNEFFIDSFIVLFVLV